MIEIRKASEIGLQLWDAFVQEHPHGRYCFLSGYTSVLKRVYGLKPHLLAAMDGSVIQGVLPVFTGAGKGGNSIPFSQFGGPLIAQHASAGEVCRYLLREATQACAGKGIIVRGVCEGVSLAAVGKEVEVHEHAVLNLPESADILFDTMFKRSVKKAIRKGNLLGVVVREDHGEELIREFFYPRYLLAMKNFGTPPHPLVLFTEMARCMPEALKIFYAFIDDKPVAGLLGLATKNVVNILSIVSDSSYLRYYPNDMVHWAFIKWAIEKQCRFFDFGVIRYPGQRQFKKKWGCELKPYRIAGVGHNVNLENTNAGVGTLASLWKTCIPLSLTPVLGRYIRKRFGR